MNIFFSLSKLDLLANKWGEKYFFWHRHYGEFKKLSMDYLANIFGILSHLLTHPRFLLFFIANHFLYFLIPRFWHSLDRTSYVFYQFFKTWLFTHTDLLSFLFYTFQISSKYWNIYQEKNKKYWKKIIINQPINSWF